MKLRSLITLTMAAIVAVLTIVAILLVGESEHRLPVEKLPWDVKRLPDGGSEVFGWTLGRTTLKDVSDELGAIPDVGLFVVPNEEIAAEAYFGRVTLGVLDARLVLSLDIDQESLRTFAEHALKSEPMPSGARKLELIESDLRVAYLSPIAGITYVPYARYDAVTIRNRFGEPAERIAVSDGASYWMYPELGLAILNEDEGPNTMEYVEPRRFEALRARVLQNAATNAPH